jgi:ATP-dependent Clp protease protease subunit
MSEPATPTATADAKPTWYAISRKADSPPDVAEVSIYDAIGAWGINAESFVNDLKAIKAKTINIRINTPGGEVFDATAIYNAIREHPAKVVCYVDGLAASSGSFIAVAGDEVRMADNAYMMIHNASGGVMGGAEDMRRYADTLEKVNGNIAAMYQRKAGKDPAHWRDLMTAETWFTAEEAKAQGLVDEVYAPSKKSPATATAKAPFDFKIYNKVPNAVQEAFAPPAAPDPEPEPTNQITEPAPEVSPPGDPSPGIPTEEPAMATETVSPPAQNPAPADSTQGRIARLNDQAIQDFIEKGKVVGRAEGRAALMDEFRAIVGACPGRAQTAINGFLAGQNASTVKLIVDAENNAEIAASKRSQEQEVEIARLNADRARLMELNNIGGHRGVPMGNVSVYAPGNNHIEDSTVSGLEPEQQAKLEWDADAMLRAKHSNNEKQYTLYRVNQLKGNVRVLKLA